VENKDVRWVQRFQNFTRACALLSEVGDYDLANTPPIVREGFVQRFEIAFDLAWKTAKDYMEFEGIQLQSTPRAVIKEAFASNIISDGQVFIDMLETRNLMSHRYDEETFNAAFVKIKKDFYPAIEQLRLYLEENAQ
jgi:nucleotidyltransferase substrate binding protein (TIGR01987 family)